MIPYISPHIISSGAVAQILIAFVISVSSIGIGIWMYRDSKRTRSRKLRRRSFFVIVIGNAISLALFVPGAIQLYTENLWFSEVHNELHYESVFWKLLKIRWGLFAKFAIVAAVFLGINYLIIDLICPISSEFRRWTRHKTNFVRKTCGIIIVLIAVVIAVPMMLFWDDFIKYENKVPVGRNQIGILNLEQKNVLSKIPKLDKQVSSLAFDHDDNLYVIKGNSIFAVDIDTGDLIPVVESIDEPRDITFDEDGNMYVVAGDSVYQIQEAGESRRSEWSKPAPDFRKRANPVQVLDNLSHPSAIAFNSKGELYIADFDKNEIIKVTGFARFKKRANPVDDNDGIRTLQKEVIIEYSKSDREKRAKSIVEQKLVIDGDSGELVQKSVLDKLSQGMYKEAIEILAKHSVDLTDLEKSLLKSADEELSGPIDLAYSENEDLFYVAEWKSGEISKIDLSHPTINRVAEGLSNPRSLVIDNDDNLYIAEASSGEITSVNLQPEEAISDKSAARSTPSESRAMAESLHANRIIRGLSSPTSLAIDSDGRIYLAESLDRDQIFNKEIGFFMFGLPVYNIVSIWVKVLTWVTIIFCGIVYNFYYNRDPQSMERIKFLGVKHLSFLVLILFGISILRSRLNVYNLMTSPLMARHYGIGYTDMVARIPGYKIFMAILVVLGIVIIINMFKRRKFLWYISALVWPISYLVLIWLIPFLFYELKVDPNELILEPPFIRRHIDATRKGFELDKIKEQDTKLSQATMDTIRENADVLRNIQLWDRRALYETAMQLQIIRHYYAFHKYTDVDRYTITMEDGSKQYRALLLAAREITTELIDPATWINKHLKYTHGYGLCVAPVNEFTDDGRPVFWVRDIPPVSQFPSGTMIKELEVTRPEIYYGEMTDTYVIARTEPEFDYTDKEDTTYQYEGHGGIAMENIFRRLAFSWQFKRLKIMLSQSIRSDSRMMYRREVLKRAKACAPFLEFDEDPFIVVGESGKLWWIIDTYVKDKNYPYAQPFPIIDKKELKRYAPSDPGIQDFRGSNYIRNPAVAIIDAYDGDVEIFILNKNEPLIKIYDKAFPGIFKNKEEIPDGLEKHIRYPDTYLYLKAQMYAKYHQDDPETFYGSEDLWQMPKEKYSLDYIYMTPYFAIFPLPGEEPRPEFANMFPFIPPGTSRKMAAWLVGRSDVPHYGETIVYKLPPNERPDSPEQVEGRIEKLPTYATDIEILGEKIIRGNLLVIPIGNDIVYVEPIYYQERKMEGDSSVTPMPEIRYVFVAASDKLAISTTMGEAIEKVFVGEKVGQVANLSGDSAEKIWSQWTQVLRGNKINTIDGEILISAQMTFDQILDAEVADNDTVTLSGTDHDGKQVWGKIPISPTKEISDFLVNIEKEFSDTISTGIDESGRILIVDGTEGESKLSLSLTVNNEGGGNLSFGQITTVQAGSDKPRSVSQLITSANTNYQQWSSLMGEGKVEEAAKTLTFLKKDLEALEQIGQQLQSALNSLTAKIDALEASQDLTDEQNERLQAIRSDVETLLKLVEQTSGEIVSKL